MTDNSVLDKNILRFNVDNLLNNNNMIHFNDDVLNSHTVISNDLNVFDEYLINNIQETYKLLFQALLKLNPDKKEKYETILKFYANNYRYAALAIETNNIKEEIKNLNDLLK